MRKLVIRLCLLFLTLSAVLPTTGCNDILGVFGKNPIGCCYPLGNTGSAHWSTQSSCADSTEYWILAATNAAERDAMAACQRTPKPSAKLLEPSIDLGDLALAETFMKSNAIHSANFASMHLVTFAHPIERADSPPTSCLATCSDVTDFSCTVASLTTQTSKPLSQLITQVNGQPAMVIQAKDLMKMFGQSADPCKRGPTSISSTTINNSGKNACTLKAQLGDTKADVLLDIPKQLQGQWISRMSPMQIQFTDSQLAPTVAFHDANGKSATKLDRDFGGKVLMAETDGQRFFLKTKGGCVGVSLEPR